MNLAVKSLTFKECSGLKVLDFGRLVATIHIEFVLVLVNRLFVVAVMEAGAAWFVPRVPTNLADGEIRNEADSWARKTRNSKMTSC